MPSGERKALRLLEGDHAPRCEVRRCRDKCAHAWEHGGISACTDDELDRTTRSTASLEIEVGAMAPKAFVKLLEKRLIGGGGEGAEAHLRRGEPAEPVNEDETRGGRI